GAVVGGGAAVEHPDALAVAIDVDADRGAPFAPFRQLGPADVLAIRIGRGVGIGALRLQRLRPPPERRDDDDCERAARRRWLPHGASPSRTRSGARSSRRARLRRVSVAPARARRNGLAQAGGRARAWPDDSQSFRKSLRRDGAECLGGSADASTLLVDGGLEVG